MEGFKVEELKRSSKPELLDLFTEAFRDGHPLIPALSRKPEATRKVMKAFLDFFRSSPKSLIYGIREDGKLVCASVSVDSTKEPSMFALIRFIISLCGAIGWKNAKELETVHKEEPKYEESYLELVLLGTLPSYQRQGYGRKMLRFLYELAKKEGFKGITLVADKNTPAFHFYQKEGFIVDKECNVCGRTLCWMRLTFQ
ncbi:MAG: GNAT family N-acetyltransferase [Candidatus Bathyarchaeia archaeon]